MDPTDILPRRNLPELAEPWGRKIEEITASHTGSLLGLDSSLKGLNRSTASSLQDLSRQLLDLTDLVNIQIAMQARQYAEYTASGTTISGPTPTAFAAVNISSPTGRIEIGYGGTMNGGQGWIYYGVTNTLTGVDIISPSSVVTNNARRVAIAGGANFAPSGYRTQPLDVPVNTMVTITAYGQDASATYLGVNVWGVSISAQIVA